MGRSTREEWAERIARWRASGRTTTEFASEIGVRARTLAWWAWRLGSKTRARPARRAARTLVASEKAATPLTFVEMTAAVEADRLELVLPTRVRIGVRPGFDAATLNRLLDVLEARR